MRAVNERPPPGTLPQPRPLRQTTARILREEEDRHAVICNRRLGMIRHDGLLIWCEQCSLYHLVPWAELWKSLVWFARIG